MEATIGSVFLAAFITALVNGPWRGAIPVRPHYQPLVA